MSKISKIELPVYFLINGEAGSNKIYAIPDSLGKYNIPFFTDLIDLGKYKKKYNIKNQTVLSSVDDVVNLIADLVFVANVKYFVLNDNGVNNKGYYSPTQLINEIKRFNRHKNVERR